MFLFAKNAVCMKDAYVHKRCFEHWDDYVHEGHIKGFEYFCLQKMHRVLKMLVSTKDASNIIILLSTKDALNAFIYHRFKVLWVKEECHR